MAALDWLVAAALVGTEAAVLCALFVPLTMRLATRTGWVSKPRGGRHLHERPMPVLGGVAIVAGFLVVVAGNALAAWLLRDWATARFPAVGPYFANIPSVSTRLVVVLGGGLLVFTMGLIDDRRPLGPLSKLAVMLLAAGLLPVAGITIRGFLPWPWLGWAATVLWVVFLTNSFNFLDNMDGLCAGVAAIAALAFAAVSFFAGEWFMTALYAAFAGSLVGFLPWNRAPARTFMGDNGSLFVGYMLGALSVLSTWYERGVPTFLPVLTPAIVLGVPIFDTLSVMWIRARNGLPLMQGDRNHFSHRLVDLGMSPSRAVTFVWVVTGVVALGAVPLRTVGAPGALAILLQTALVFTIIHRLERRARRLTRHEE